MMGWGSQCYIQSFVEIGLPVLEEDFSRVFTIYGHGGHLGHVTSIMSSDFHFLVPESFHKKIDYDWQSSLCMYTTLGQGQVMTLTFNTHTFIYSIRCLLLPTFRSLPARVSEKFTVFPFSYRKAYVTKFDFAVK